MQPLEQRLMRLTALFEGSANGAINTWDEQFLSLGTLHYAVGQGSGCRFLMRIQQLDPAGTLACLGAPFVQAIKGGEASIKAFCRVNVWKTGQKWTRAFQALSRLAAYQQADAECAAPYLDGARKLAQRYNLKSERGLAWAFDRCVQQGDNPRPSVDAVYKQVQGKSELEVMQALAKAYADSATPWYYTTVLQRSRTVALGHSFGTGYPGTVNLTDYGLSLERPWAAPTPPTVFMTDPNGKNIQWDGNESAVYQGQRITTAWVEQMKLVYPKGSKTTLSTSTGRFTLEVYADGALQLRRV